MNRTAYDNKPVIVKITEYPEWNYITIHDTKTEVQKTFYIFGLESLGKKQELIPLEAFNMLLKAFDDNRPVLKIHAKF